MFAILPAQLRPHFFRHRFPPNEDKPVELVLGSFVEYTGHVFAGVVHVTLYNVMLPLTSELSRLLGQGTRRLILLKVEPRTLDGFLIRLTVPSTPRHEYSHASFPRWTEVHLKAKGDTMPAVVATQIAATRFQFTVR
jgi:hypothetical protein